MLACAPQLLLGVRIRNGKATYAVAGFGLIALLLRTRALGTEGAARLGSIEAQFQRPVQQIGKNITGRVYYYCVINGGHNRKGNKAVAG